MALDTDQFEDDELEPSEDEVKDYLDDFGDDDDLENLSSDVDRWDDDSFDADRDYLYGLLR